MQLRHASRSIDARTGGTIAIFALLGVLSGCSSGSDGESSRPNVAPVADAGPDAVVLSGATVQLDGSASVDANNDALTYQWTQLSGLPVTLSNMGVANPTFDAPAGMSADEILTFNLVVSDASSSSAPDSVTITVRGTAPLAADGFVGTVAAVVSKGHFTMNNPWTAADLEFENITPDLTYGSLVGIHPAGRYRAYTTMMETYLARRRQCEEDYNALYPQVTWQPPLGSREYTFRDRKCYPQLELANDLDKTTIGFPTDHQTLHRYGYYCGGGYPDGFGVWDPNAPEPIDGVDYCCRLHDAGAWADYGDNANECGIAMCLRQGSMWPAGLDAQLTDMLESRSHWYGDGALAGAAIACPGVQSNNAPPLLVKP